MAIACPAYGQLSVSNELKKKGIIISSGGVRSIWLRHDLNHLPKRFAALAAKMAQDGKVWNIHESQYHGLLLTKILYSLSWALIWVNNTCQAPACVKALLKRHTILWSRTSSPRCNPQNLLLRQGCHWPTLLGHDLVFILNRLIFANNYDPITKNKFFSKIVF